MSSPDSTNLNEAPELSLWSAIWNSNVMPKVKMFIWKLVSKAIAVKECLSRRGMLVQVGCPMCSAVETIEHLILDCDWAKAVWFELLGLVDVRDGCNSVNQWLLRRLSDQSGSSAGFEWHWYSVLTACWAIWKGRCVMAYEGSRPNPYQAVHQVRLSVRELSLLAQYKALQSTQHRMLSSTGARRSVQGSRLARRG